MFKLINILLNSIYIKMKKKINLHFSVDDVFESLIEVSDKNISLKKHWFFSKFYFLWKKYKLKTGLYLFYEVKLVVTCEI